MTYKLIVQGVDDESIENLGTIVAHTCFVMCGMRFVLILSAFVFEIRIFIRISDDFRTLRRLQAPCLEDFLCFAICSITFFITKTVFVAPGAILPFIKLTQWRRKISREERVIALISQIKMRMCAGISFESATKDLFSQTNDQNLIAAEVFWACRQYPTQSFSFLSALLRTLELKHRLLRKQSAATLQAKAQACVGIVLYGLVFAMQFAFQMHFDKFIASFLGRTLIYGSLVCLLCGTYLVFSMARAREFNP